MHIYSDYTVSTIKREVYGMQEINVVLLKFGTKLQYKLIYYVHTLVRFIPVEYEEGDAGVEPFEKVESSEIIDRFGDVLNQLIKNIKLHR